MTARIKRDIMEGILPNDAVLMDVEAWVRGRRKMAFWAQTGKFSTGKKVPPPPKNAMGVITKDDPEVRRPARKPWGMMPENNSFPSEL